MHLVNPLSLGKTEVSQLLRRRKDLVDRSMDWRASKATRKTNGKKAPCVKQRVGEVLVVRVHHDGELSAHQP